MKSDAVSPKVADSVDKVMSQGSPTNSSQQQQPLPTSQHHHEPYHHQPQSPANDTQHHQQQHQQQFEVSGPESQSPRAEAQEQNRNMVTSTPGHEEPARADLRYTGYRADLNDSLDKSGPEDDEEGYGSEGRYDIRSPGIYRNDPYPDRRLTYDSSMSPDKEDGEGQKEGGGEGRQSPEGPPPFSSPYRHFPQSSAPFSSAVSSYHQDLARMRYRAFDHLAGNGSSTSVTYSYGTPPRDSPSDPYSFEQERERAHSPGYPRVRADRDRGAPVSPRNPYNRYDPGDDPEDPFKRNRSFSPRRDDRSPPDASLLNNTDPMSSASKSPKSGYPPSPGAYTQGSPRYLGGHPADLMSPPSGGKLRPVFDGGLPSLPLVPRFPGGGPLPSGYGQPQLGADGKHIYFCHLCSYSGATKEDFDAHMSIHFEYNCPHCDYTSRTEGRLKRHIKDFHTDPENKQRTMPGRPKIFKCKQCEFSCVNKVEFWTHARTHIKEDKLLQCPRCPFVTEYKHHLEYHLRNHFGSKPFKCNKCNYSCVNKSMLNSHMKSHTNVYQYRCADCTYATKYCHSLKLHLRKYGHKPATVLNSDGSLPQGIDAEISGLSLLAKRGPPRGPRGLRKDKDGGLSEAFLPPSMCPPLYMPPGEMGPLNPLLAPRGLMPGPYWPMMPNGMHPPPPLIPVTSMSQHPLLPGLEKLNGLQGPGAGGEEERESASAIKCKMCTYCAETMEGLEAHVLKVHAAENKDLLSMLPFNIPPETLLDEQAAKLHARRMSAPPSGPLGQDTSPDAFLRRNTMPSSESSPLRKPALGDLVKSSPSSWPRPMHSVSMAEGGPFPNYARSLFPGNMRDQSEQDEAREPPQEGADILRQMTLKFGASPSDTSPARPQLPVPPPSISQASLQGALDLTKPRSLSSPYTQSPPSANSTTPESVKRKVSGEHSEDNGCPSDPAATNPRKRSRKGKAYKLDALCLKLQEKQAASPCDSDSQGSPAMDSAAEAREMQDGEDRYRDYSDRVEIAVGTEHPERAAELERMQNEASDQGENMDNDFEQLQKNLQILNSDNPSSEISSHDMKEEARQSVDETSAGEENTTGASKVQKAEAVGEEGSEAVDCSPRPLVVSEAGEDDVDPVKERAAILSAIYKSQRDAVPPAIRRGTELALKIFNETSSDGTSPPNGKTGTPSRAPPFEDMQEVSPRNGLNHGSMHKITLSKQPLNGCGDPALSPPPPFPARMSTHAQTQPPSSAPMAPDTSLIAKVMRPSPKKEVYECPYCEIAFRNGVMYSMHMGYHSAPNPYQCNICGQTSRDSVDFFLHIARAAHT